MQHSKVVLTVLSFVLAPGKARVGCAVAETLARCSLVAAFMAKNMFRLEEQEMALSQLFTIISQKISCSKLCGSGVI